MAELSAEDRERLSAYTGLVQKTWEDEGFKERALAEPRAALAEHGWEVADGTEVRIEVVEFDAANIEDPPAPEAIAAAWKDGIESGELGILVPSAPPASEPELISDEELAGVDGGFTGPPGWCACSPGCVTP
jgi:hypothetical protein